MSSTPPPHALLGRGWCGVHRLYFPLTKWGCPICYMEKNAGEMSDELIVLLNSVRIMNKDDTNK